MRQAEVVTWLWPRVGRVGLALAVLTTPFLLRAPGTVDVDIWLRWMDNLDQLGLRTGYVANEADYPPLMSVILYAVVRVADWLQVDHFTALKTSLLLGLLLTVACFWAWTRNAGRAGLLYGALLINSVALGYTDIFMAPPLVLAFWALQKNRLSLFAMLFSVASLIKWQPLITVPFIVVYLALGPLALWERMRVRVGDALRMALPPPKLATEELRIVHVLPPINHPTHGGSGIGWSGVAASHNMPPPLREGTRKLAAVWPGAAVGGLALIVFGPEVIAALHRAMHHPYLSGNALNLNWVATYWLQVTQPQVYGPLVEGAASYILTDDPGLMYWPRLLFGAAYLTLLGAFMWRVPSVPRLLWFALLGYLAYFTLAFGVHENHLFTAMVLAAALCAVTGQALPLVGVALAANINLIIFYGFDGFAPSVRVVGVDLTLPLAALNMALFVALMVLTLRRAAVEYSWLSLPGVEGD